MNPLCTNFARKLLGYGLLSVLIAGCGPIQTLIGTQTFVDGLDRNLKNNSVGYAFSVSYRDNWVDERANGQARIAADPPARAITPIVKFSTASLSKTVTAAAALKLLEPIHSVNKLNDSIGPYLPTDFNADANFQRITFKQLLQHRSGIGTATDSRGNPIDALDIDYNGLRNYVSSHPNISNKSGHYSNTNYALFRILIPKLANARLTGDPGQAYAAAYMQYVKENVFTPLGLFGMSAASDEDTGLNYHFPLPARPTRGMDLGDLTTRVASQGWVMSSQDLAHFLRDLHYSENIVTSSVAQQMKDDCMGYDVCDAPVSSGSKFRYWAKGGFYPGCYGTNAGEFQGSLVVFSNDISVSLIVNSNEAYKSSPDRCGYPDNQVSPGNQFQAILDAFDSAYGK